MYIVTPALELLQSRNGTNAHFHGGKMVGHDALSSTDPKISLIYVAQSVITRRVNFNLLP